MERSTISFSANTSPQINLYIKNRGQVTAHNIALQGLDYVYRKPFTDRLKLVPNDEWDVYPSLAPGGGAQAFSLRTSPLTAKQIKEILKGKKLFFHCATGRYEDAEGNQYPFNFCFMYRFRHAGTGSVRLLAIAPVENWPEEYWPKKNATQDNPAMKDNEKPKTTNTTINRSIVNSPGASGNVLGDVSIHHHAPPPRLVTVAQANKMIAVLQPHSGSTLAIVWLSNNNEAFTYADQIARVFQSAGWQVQEVGAFSGTAIGVGVVCEGKFPIAEASAVVAAFREAELQITERTVPGWPEGKWRLVVGEKP